MESFGTSVPIGQRRKLLKLLLIEEQLKPCAKHSNVTVLKINLGDGFVDDGDGLRS